MQFTHSWCKTMCTVYYVFIKKFKMQFLNWKNNFTHSVMLLNTEFVPLILFCCEYIVTYNLRKPPHQMSVLKKCQMYVVCVWHFRITRFCYNLSKCLVSEASQFAFLINVLKININIFTTTFNTSSWTTFNIFITIFKKWF